MTKLTLLDDVPAGRGERALVEFNHGLYAELLRDVLLDNRPGTCVGFFARWGQGKSTVLNVLSSILGDRARMVVFNAYQARGDSVRRQLLLSVLRQVDPKQADELERFTQIVTPLELQTAEIKQRHEGGKLAVLLLKAQGDPLLALLSIGAATSGGLLLWSFIAMVITADTFDNRAKAIVTALSGTFLFFAGAVSRWIAKRKDKILAYTQPVSDSQRLKYPEQFTRVFRQAVEGFNKSSGRRLIVVIDDLDRCDPNTVVEALASVRSFCHSDAPLLDCQFLMPCDEKQMLSALEADGHRYHDYSKTELLRKFFDVVVRMDEIVPESMAKYAAQQAKIIGVDSLLARDMIDAGGVREPRKVKALLNAYRVAREAVARNEANNKLPPVDQLERFEATLGVLVCLQELAPDTSAMVRADPDLLVTADLGGADEPVARRLVAGLGPVSVATADILITKQYEPSLHGVSKAHALTAADRAGNIAQLVRTVVDANAVDRGQMLAWIVRKLREARSSARVRELIVYVVEISADIGSEHETIMRFCQDLRRWKTLLPEALRLERRLDGFAKVVGSLEESDRFFYDAVILKNYLSGPAQNASEERYLLRFSSRLSSKDASDFRRALESSILPSPQDVNVPHLYSLAENLDDLDRAADGFAVDLGERLFNGLLNNIVNVESHKPLLVVGLRLVGADKGAAGRLLNSVLKSGYMERPGSITPDYYRDRGIFFGLLKGLLRRALEWQEFVTYFRLVYWGWFEAQTNNFGRFCVAEAIQPAWGILPKEELQRIGAHYANWIWHEKEFAQGVCTVVDQSPRKDEPWILGRGILRDEIFIHVCRNCRGHSQIPEPAQEFFKTVAEAGWQISSHAEELLSDKVRRFVSGEGGRPDSLEHWSEALIPLCSGDLKVLRREVTNGLASTDRPLDLVDLAVKQFWSVEIPAEMAPAFASAILVAPDAVFDSRERFASLSGLKGFDEVARVVYKQLPRHGPQWMHSHARVLRYLSSWSTAAPDASRRFQEGVIDTLLTGTDLEWPRLGVELLKEHSMITADVRRSLDGLVSRAGDDSELKKATAAELGKALF